MTKKLGMAWVFLSLSSILWGHELNHVSCGIKDSGCYVGRYSLGAGVGWSRFKERTAFWPHAELQIGLLNILSLELMAGGINAQGLYGSLKGVPTIIGGVGLQYYPNRLYQGLVIRSIVMNHLYRQDLSNDRYSVETALLSTVGWRWNPEKNSGSFVVGLGGQRVFAPQAKIQPVIQTDIAVDFNLDSIFF
ncbi:MAG: hypothetical protein NT000_06805 [Proteobacteria bacterium]|nr:hypothetical protein [Pseudomonadota bacterium]